MTEVAKTEPIENPAEPPPVENPTPNPEPSGPTDADVAACLAEHGGDFNATMAALFTDIEAKKAEIVALEANLTPEELASLDAWKALGTPEEITKKLEEHKAVEQQIEAHRREERFAEAGKLLEYKPEVLSTIAEMDGLDIVIRDEKDPKTQKPVKIPYLVDAAGKRIPVVEHAEKHWKVWAPALTAKQPPPLVLRGSPVGGGGPPRPPIGKVAGERRNLIN